MIVLFFNGQAMSPRIPVFDCAVALCTMQNALLLISNLTGHVARMPLFRAPRKILSSWVDNPRPLGCPQMNWGRTLKKALQSNDLPTEFVKWREMAADRNQWRAICGSKMPSTTKETLDEEFSPKP
jgi:hypothetical protein